MKKIIPFALMSSLLMLVSSCAAIEGIFKAGVWSGILMVVVVVAIVIWLISKLFGGSKWFYERDFRYFGTYSI